MSEECRDGERELCSGYGGPVSALVHAGKEAWVWRRWPRRPWATWQTCTTGRVARLALGGVRGAQPCPERKRVSTVARTLAAWVAAARLGGPALSVSDLGHWPGPQSLGWVGGCSLPQRAQDACSPGRANAHGQARVWSEAGEGPELWWSPPPSPVGTALTLAGLGHAERRGRGRGGRPQTSVEREPNCKIQRQEPPDCRWGPGGLHAPPPLLAWPLGQALCWAAGQGSGLLQEGVTAAATVAQRAGGTGLQGHTPLAPEAMGTWDKQALSSGPGLLAPPPVTPLPTA